MMNVLSSHPQNVQPRMHEISARGRPCKVAAPNSWSPSSVGAQLAILDPNNSRRPSFRRRAVAVRAVSDGGESSSGKDDDDDDEEENQSKKEEGSSAGLSRREDLERLLGPDDARFNGLDLATLIRNKYGRSYDVTLIKKEFMGRNLLAMNVMWKYREQRSFPLTEEEYLLRLDEVANTLKCWGAVAHVRNTLEKLKERPRIGKAVSIFIDMDETGGRSNEWIYK